MDTNANTTSDKGLSEVVPCMECLELINSTDDRPQAHGNLSLTARNQTVAHLALYKCRACGANLLQGRTDAKSSWAYFI
jgi:hypothetical protein